jgi:hypothetical protein
MDLRKIRWSLIGLSATPDVCMKPTGIWDLISDPWWWWPTWSSKRRFHTDIWRGW